MKLQRLRAISYGAILLILATVLASCSWPWQAQSPQDQGSPATVTFPGAAAGLKASVTPLQNTQEMTDAVPSGVQIHDGVSLAMESGDFPEGGADINFNLDTPLADDRIGTVVYWNPADQAWEPVESSLSEDRLTMTSHVKHFSVYAWWESFKTELTKGTETVYNGLGKALGDKTDPPTCTGGEPEWADAVYPKDNINAPVLWCVGTDGNNSDVMEVRLKLNRPGAGSVTTASKPAWVWSDLWQTIAPQTWTQMAAQGAASSNQLGEKYLLQPLGEYRFGFNRKQLMEFYNKTPNTPLITVGSTITYTVAGLMYQAVEGKAAGNMAGVFVMTSLMECGGNLVGAAGESVGKAFGALMPCLNDRKDAIAVATAKAWLKLNPTASWENSVAASKKIGGVIRAAGGWYALIRGTYSIGAVIGDLTLDPSLRQLTFSPSLEEIKRQTETRKKAAAGTSAPGLPGQLRGKWCPDGSSMVGGSFACYTIASSHITYSGTTTQNEIRAEPSTYVPGCFSLTAGRFDLIGKAASAVAPIGLYCPAGTAYPRGPGLWPGFKDFPDQARIINTQAGSMYLRTEP